MYNVEFEVSSSNINKGGRPYTVVLAGMKGEGGTSVHRRLMGLMAPSGINEYEGNHDIPKPCG